AGAERGGPTRTPRSSPPSPREGARRELRARSYELAGATQVRQTGRRERLDSMRAFLLVALLLAACSSQPNAAASLTPSPTAVASTPAPSPTRTPSPSSSPTTLHSLVQLSAPPAAVVSAL